LPLIITSAEKSCTFTNFSLWYPNVLAKLAYEELKRLPNITAHRRSGAKMYVDVLWDAVLAPLKDWDVYLRIIYKTQQQKACIIEAKKQWFHLWDPRYDTVIAGRSVDFDDAQYLLGSCPRAEELAGKTLNLPNHMLMEKSDYKRVIEFVSHFTTTT
jgi:dTDP-4-amino-4,6-dideoxygalactose transaminase